MLRCHIYIGGQNEIATQLIMSQEDDFTPATNSTKVQNDDLSESDSDEGDSLPDGVTFASMLMPTPQRKFPTMLLVTVVD